MKRNDIFLKFGDEKYMNDFFYNGSVYMNSLGYFRKEALSDPQRGDMHECAIRNKPLGGVTFYKGNTLVGTFLSGNMTEHCSKEDDFKVFCLYSATYEELTQKVNLSQIGSDVIDGFGDTCILIIDTKEFIRRLIQHENSNIKYGCIQYINFSAYEGVIGPFIKDNKFKHQNEFRVCVLKEDSGFSHHVINIGSIEDIAFKFKSSEVRSLSVILKGKAT
jgi:hypothetical protein